MIVRDVTPMVMQRSSAIMAKANAATKKTMADVKPIQQSALSDGAVPLRKPLQKPLQQPPRLPI